MIIIEIAENGKYSKLAEKTARLKRSLSRISF